MEQMLQRSNKQITNVIKLLEIGTSPRDALKSTAVLSKLYNFFVFPSFLFFFFFFLFVVFWGKKTCEPFCQCVYMNCRYSNTWDNAFSLQTIEVGVEFRKRPTGLFRCC